MTYLSNLAQYYSYDVPQTLSSSDYSTGDILAVLGLSSGMIFFLFIVSVAMYVIMGIFLGKIFKKAGVEAWIAWVPFYNYWKLLEIGGQKGFWAVLSILPIVSYVSLVFQIIAMYHIGKKLGKSGAFVLLGIFLSPVWYIWLGIDDSTWNDKASTAPSLHKATKA